jgi:ferrochelatase
MDGRVLDVNWVSRFCLVNFAILPSRPAASAEAYQKIWTSAGSPLVVTSRNVATKLQARTSVPIELAMRYQNPSIPDAIRKLKNAALDELLLVPLFPHYAMSSYESAVVRVQEVAGQIAPGMRVQVQPPYFDQPEYIRALVASAEDHLKRGFDHLLFSFHGVPERQIRKSDPTGCHCLAAQNCCEVPSRAHTTCYRAQCFKTVAAFVQAANVPAGKYSVSFQSRLGRTPWLKPYTDFELERLPGAGIKKLLVICPAFVADCLETIEEIGMRGHDSFIGAGGKEFAQIPCLNEHPLWLDTLNNMIGAFLSGTGKSPESKLQEK